MCYPEDHIKANWDIFVSFILVFTCIMTPANMAFEEELGVAWEWILSIIDGLFFVDCIITFNSAYEDEDFRIIEDYKPIAIYYLKSWFIIDIFAIIPFDLIIMSTTTSVDSSVGFNGMVRMLRMGRMYKLIKLTKLIRILKVVKEKSKVAKTI